jgi:hypothetical protein
MYKLSLHPMALQSAHQCTGVTRLSPVWGWPHGPHVPPSYQLVVFHIPSQPSQTLKHRSHMCLSHPFGAPDAGARPIRDPVDHVDES